MLVVNFFIKPSSPSSCFLLSAPSPTSAPCLSIHPSTQKRLFTKIPQCIKNVFCMYRECIMMDVSMYHLKVAASLCSASTLASSPFCLSRTASNASGGGIEYLSHVTDLFAILDVSWMYQECIMLPICLLYWPVSLYSILSMASYLPRTCNKKAMSDKVLLLQKGFSKIF